MAERPDKKSRGLFFHEELIAGTEIIPAEDTLRHMMVLRLEPGEHLQLTDGRGTLAEATVASVQKKKCGLFIKSVSTQKAKEPALHLAVAFTKNAARNEWLLEKATEMGVHTIIPLQTTRSEKEKIKHERWQNILISAMLQSQQHHLPKLEELMSLKQLIEQHRTTAQKLVAHCIQQPARKSISEALQPHKETLIIIGPEGDLTAEEVSLCEQEGCIGISLGSNRLRTETAAMATCAYFNMVNQ
jgi:16S rRNA (uracil1498-N3)-methyltransferase